MENIDKIQAKLDSLASALLLFSDDRLVVINAYGRQLLPNLKPGDSAETVFGDSPFHQFSGAGTMLFPADISGLMLDAKISMYDDYIMAELLETTDSLSASALRSISEGILGPMSTVMALTPKLLPQLEHTEDPANMERAAQLNKGIYSLLRAANHIRLAGLEQDHLLLNKKRIRVLDWLQDFTGRIDSICETAGRRLHTQLPALDDMCDLDQDQMERAILNLVSNAIKYTKDGGIITISAAKASKNRIRITIRDNGCGIPAYEMGVIFRRKEHRPQLPDPRIGIGLGLPITRTIVKGHGGNLLVESQENVGTAVHLWISTVRGTDYPLYSDIQKPSHSGGFNPILVELSDVLPSSIFDTRGIDL